MARKSLSSQLNAIRSDLNVSTDPEPGERPLTPSILFDSKTAAGIDLDTILRIALEGLEILIRNEERFRDFKENLFSLQRKVLDREVHEYNAEDLILCALPYHGIPVFGQIIRLINAGNSRWKFLNGVKESGARLPRDDIARQCVQDMGVLEAICKYATPVKKIQPSQQVAGFCTAVIFEVLGLGTFDNDIVWRILPYVNSWLQLGAEGLNLKSSALMIVGLLAQNAALEPEVFILLLHSVAFVAGRDAKEGLNLQWLRNSVLTIISIVQRQRMEAIPEKTLNALNEIRDVSVILSGVTKDFNIDKFLDVLLVSLLEYSASNDVCYGMLLSMIKTVPMKPSVGQIVSRLLAKPIKLLEGTSEKHILVSIFEKYPNESWKAFYSVWKDAKIQPKKVKSSYDVLRKILDELLGASQSFLYLGHSEAEVRRSAVLRLDVAKILREKSAGSKIKFHDLQAALLHLLDDNDLNVALAVLNLEKLPEILSSPLLLGALHKILDRCIRVLFSTSSSHKDLALLCTQQVITNFKDQAEYATMIFPLLLVQAKTWKLNFKALESAKELRLPLYENLVLHPRLEKGQIYSVTEQNFKLNSQNIIELAKTFLLRPDEYMPWLVMCCSFHKLSKTLFYLILVESLRMQKWGVGQFFKFFDSCFPILKDEWGKLELQEKSTRKLKIIQDAAATNFLTCLDTDIDNLHAWILSCLFMGLSETFVATIPNDESLDTKEKRVSILKDMFIFYSCHSSGHSEVTLKPILEYLSDKCMKLSMELTFKLIVEEGIPSAAQIYGLQSFSSIATQIELNQSSANDAAEIEHVQPFLNIRSDSDETLVGQFLAQFPSVLVPLSSDSQHVRGAAIGCFQTLCHHTTKEGKSVGKLYFLKDLLSMIIQQAKLISLDKNHLYSLFKSLLCSSESLPVPSYFPMRLIESKNDILVFVLDHALGLPAYAKLKILSLVNDVGRKLLSNSGMRSLLSDLLESRRLGYLCDGKSCNKLSQSEVDLLCLLLECCTKANSVHEAHDFGDIVLKALWVNDSEDSAIIEPCTTILRNLSSSLYEEMKIETQDLIRRHLLVLSKSTQSVIRDSTKETMLRINMVHQDDFQ